MNLPADTRYSEAVWMRFRHPRHAGRLEGSGVAAAEAKTPGSRAVLRMQLRIEAGRISAARFLAYGCVATIAAADWFAHNVEGKTIAEAGGLSPEDAVGALDLPPVKRHCALLAADVLKAVLAQAEKGAIGDNSA